MTNPTANSPSTSSASAGAPAGPVIEAIAADIGYGAMPVVRNLHLAVHPGEIVALLGVNGAGKSTTVRALAGELKPTAGEIRIRGVATTAPLHKRARQGLRLITEERSVFMGLTAADNLRLGGQTRDDVLAIFPELARVMRRKAGLLSGGEQQMLTLGRALASRPDILLIDELSLGLAPLILERLLAEVKAAAARGAGVLLVEQHIRHALEAADRAYLLSHGEVVISGAAAELLDRVEEIEQTYLAAGELTDVAG
jgi:branched-chain amino acid transport system ATP-binding protein